MRHIESKIQIACKRWFDYQYRQFAPLLFAVPNGGQRGKFEASIMKAEGVTPGVADMILLVSRRGYGSLCIEFKTATGKQSERQKEWEGVASACGNKYVIYNPWMGRIVHFHKYCPPLKMPYEKRMADREKAYKENFKVKRGADNWYYSGGTLAALDRFNGDRKWHWRKAVFKLETFVIDRILEPVYKMFGRKFKRHAIYCYGAVAPEVWAGNYKKRLTERFVKEINKGNLFEPEVAFLYGDTSKYPLDKVREWLDNYEYKETGRIISPVQFLYVYEWYIGNGGEV